MKFKDCLAAIPMIALALVPPAVIKLPIIANTSFWIWLVLVAGFSGIVYKNTSANIWLKALALFCLATCFTAKIPYIAFTAYIMMALFFYYYLLCKKISDYTLIFKAVQGIFFINCVMLIAQLTGHDNLLNFNHETPVVLGIVGNPMQLASLLTICAPFLLVYRKWHIIPLLIFAIWIKSSGMILALGGGIIFYTWFTFKKFRMFITIGVALLIILFAWNDGLMAKFRQSGGDRWPIWVRTVQLANKKPIFGYGIGTYRVLFPVLAGEISGNGQADWRYEYTTGNQMAWRQAHNCWLQLIFEIGYVGTALVFGLIGWLIWLFVWAVKTKENVIAASGLLIILLDLTVHFPDRMPQAILIIICYMAYYQSILPPFKTPIWWDHLTIRSIKWRAKLIS